MMNTPQPQLTEEEFQTVAQQLDALVQEFEKLPFPQVREMVFDLLKAVDAIHREGLGRLIGFLQGEGQADLIDRAAADPIVHTVLLLYDLIPSDERLQVETALETIRPYVHSHGGEVEVLDVADGVVHLRLSGSCDGCAGSTMTLKRGVEAALREGWPHFKGIQVHEPEPTIPMAGFIPLDQVGHVPQRPLRRPVFKEVAPIEAIPAGTMKDFEVDGVYVLVANVAGEIYAVRGHCPGSVAPLHLGSFTPPIVVCPWHNEAFDIRTGKRADGQTGPGLDVLPVALTDGIVQLAVSVSSNNQPQKGWPEV